MKRLFLVCLLLILCFTGNAFSYEMKPFVGIGYYTPNNFIIYDWAYNGSVSGDEEWETESSYNLTAGLLLSENVKVTLFYATAEAPMTGPSGQDWSLDYSIIGSSLDYLFWRLGQDEHQGMYIGVGGSYETFDTHDHSGDGTSLSLMLKLGFEFKIEKLLIDFGFLENFGNGSFDYTDSGGARNTGDFKGLGAYYFTVAYIF